MQEGELSADQVRETDAWTMHIPEGVREVIGRHLNRLSQRCNETLTIGSIIGREFGLDRLSLLINELSEGLVLEVLEEALAARWVEELPQAINRYQFTHALIQETLAEELSTTRRVRMHARIAEVLEELYASDTESHAAELAHHFIEAQTVLGIEKPVRYLLLAGERALATYGHDDALAHFQRGLTAKRISLTASKPADDADAGGFAFGFGMCPSGHGGKTTDP